MYALVWAIPGAIQGCQYRSRVALVSAARQGTNQSGTPLRACSASSVTLSSGHPVAPAHAARIASEGQGCAGFSALLITGRDTFSRLASAPCDPKPASARDR